MKKLSLLVALALLITVSGVYATWSYAGAAAQGNHQHMSVNLEGAANTTSEGIIHSVSNTLNILIDDTNKDYTADLVITGSMGFVFTANAGAPEDVVENGISMQWQLEQTDPGIQHNGANVFTINHATPSVLTSTKVTSGNATTLCTGVDLTQYVGGFYVEITAAEVASHISSTLSLPTYNDYLAFQTELKNTTGKVGVTVSKVPTP